MAGQASGGLVGFLAGSVWKPLYTGLWVAVGFMWCLDSVQEKNHDALQ